MWFFIYVFICLSSCFAGDLGEGEISSPSPLKKTPSFDCPIGLSTSFEKTITKCARPKVVILDIDKFLVRGNLKGYTVPTRLGRRLDAFFGRHDIATLVHGLVIVTARPTRPDHLGTYTEAELLKCRKSTFEVTNAELLACVPNIAKFLRSKDNFNGFLPDFLTFNDPQNGDYRRLGFTVDPEGFVYNCGLLVMGMAKNPKGVLRHCKHFTISQFLQRSVPTPEGGFEALCGDDHLPWLDGYQKGFGPNTVVHTFHYKFEDAEIEISIKPRPVRRQLPAYHEEDNSEIEIRSLISTTFRTAVSYAIKIAVIAYALNKVHSLRQYRIVRHFEHVLNWAFHLTLNCIRRLAFKLLFERQ